METQNSEQSKPAENTGNGVQPQASSPIERAELAVKRLEEENAKLARNLEELQRVRANEILAGRAQAGTVNKVKTVDDIAQEMADETINKMFKRSF